MNLRIENWMNHEIRFIEKSAGDWWAVAKDVAKSLDYNHTPHMLRMIDDSEKDVRRVDTLGGKQKLAIISELGIYDAIFNSQKKEAKEFKRWVFDVIKQLRQSTGLEGFQIFRMLDKDHQKEAMSNLSQSLRKPVRNHFIKANTIADKAVSTKFGHPKMLKKDQMTPEMLVARQPIMEDTVKLMGLKDHFGLEELSVSEKIYEMHV